MKEIKKVTMVRTFADKKFSNRLSTVNVIEMDTNDSTILGITSFSNNTDGNSNAEILFRNIIIELEPNESKKIIEDAVKANDYNKNGYAIYIVCSC